MLRHLWLGLSLVACLLLAIAEFTDLNQIKILTVPKDGVGVGGHHGYALLIIAVVAGVMAFGAWRGSRPAALALAVLGVAALVIVLLVDRPDVNATGLYGRDYEQVTATKATGYYLETAGAILLLFSAVLTIVLGGQPAAEPPRRERRPAADVG